MRIMTHMVSNNAKPIGVREMNYLIKEIKGYMSFMSFDAAVAKVRRSHLGRNDFLINQAAEAVKQSIAA